MCDITVVTPSLADFNLRYG